MVERNDASQIASFIVRALPGAIPTISARVSALPGTEVHAIENGKIIVVIEASSDRALADSMDQMRAIDGVLAVSLVYHYSEPACS